MIAHRIVSFVGPALATVFGLAGSVLSGSALPFAVAQPCPDVEVVFARGTDEPPGVGPEGQAFVDALGSRVSGRSFGVQPVNYPATDQWATGIDGVRKTIQLCVPEDPVCSDGMNFAAHKTYASETSMIDKGADFAAGRL
jgi:hypothetical protein